MRLQIWEGHIHKLGCRCRIKAEGLKHMGGDMKHYCTKIETVNQKDWNERWEGKISGQDDIGTGSQALW